jgi:peptide subunit release factor 1 (eRF1)
MHIPVGGTAPDLNKEFSDSKNIKDRVTRNNTLAGLRAIQHYL